MSVSTIKTRLNLFLGRDWINFRINLNKFAWIYQPNFFIVILFLYYIRGVYFFEKSLSPIFKALFKHFSVKNNRLIVWTLEMINNFNTLKQMLAAVGKINVFFLGKSIKTWKKNLPLMSNFSCVPHNHQKSLLEGRGGNSFIYTPVVYFLPSLLRMHVFSSKNRIRRGKGLFYFYFNATK